MKNNWYKHYKVKFKLDLSSNYNLLDIGLNPSSEEIFKMIH